jgi:hypothetical protein
VTCPCRTTGKTKYAQRRPKGLNSFHSAAVVVVVASRGEGSLRLYLHRVGTTGSALGTSTLPTPRPHHRQYLVITSLFYPTMAASAPAGDGSFLYDRCVDTPPQRIAHLCVQSSLRRRFLRGLSTAQEFWCFSTRRFVMAALVRWSPFRFFHYACSLHRFRLQTSRCLQGSERERNVQQPW